MTIKKLADPLCINKDLDCYPQLFTYVQHLSNRQYILVQIENFKKLQPYEKQVDFNYIVIEKTVDGYKIYDNLHYREEHNVLFQTPEDACLYAEKLLSQGTVLDFAQVRAAQEFGVELGQDAWLQKNEGDSWEKVRILHHRDATHFANDDAFCNVLHYLPYKKNGELSKVAARTIYGGSILRKTLEK